MSDALVTEEYISVVLTPLRKAIAARMVEATRTIPHFRVVADLEADSLIALRRELRTRRADTDLSLNDLLIKACAAALMDVPALNIQWSDDSIRQYPHADISIVTAVAGGLSTPIVRSVESKNVWAIAREVRELAQRAARKTLRIDEVAGGSFSISNLGMYGVEQFDAIINPPQCAILAVGRAAPRVLVTAAREMRVATVMRVSLSADHRAIDGTAAAAFLAALKMRVEQPDFMRAGADD
jgi:pyruvate dehydrogenase E2 component (dihydrolipoamide acetyltransferase)